MLPKPTLTVFLALCALLTVPTAALAQPIAVEADCRAQVLVLTIDCPGDQSCAVAVPGIISQLATGGCTATVPLASEPASLHQTVGTTAAIAVVDCDGEHTGYFVEVPIADGHSACVLVSPTSAQSLPASSESAPQMTTYKLLYWNNAPDDGKAWTGCDGISENNAVMDVNWYLWYCWGTTPKCGTFAECTS